jgi:hypothetical protein
MVDIATLSRTELLSFTNIAVQGFELGNKFLLQASQVAKRASFCQINWPPHHEQNF